MIFFVQCAYVWTLWNNMYIDQVLNDWETGPITDVQVVPFTAGGILSADTSCPDGYEIGSKIYYPGLIEGCICPNSKTYPEVYYNRCTDDQLKSRLCWQIEDMPEEMLEVANESLMCIKRDTSYNYFDLKKPTLDTNVESSSGGKYVCEAGTKLCLDNESGAILGGVNPDILFCFPEDVDCPATNLVYAPSASAESMFVSTDAASGPPLSELIYSMG